MNNFNERLKELRIEKNVYQKQVANIIEKTTDTISAYEKSKAQPDINTLIKLADYFECSIDYLVGRADELDRVIIAPEYNEKEKALVNYYRALSPFEQGELLGVAKTMAKGG